MSERILFAPIEVAGQMRLLAEEFRKRGHCASAVEYYQTSDRSNFDAALGLSADWRIALQAPKLLRFVADALRSYDVFHFFFGASLIPRLYADLPLLKRLGKQVVIHFRGSDIVERVYDRGDVAPRAVLHSRGKRRVRIWRRYADAMLVSTPDLIRAVPDAVLVPQAIDLHYWGYSEQPAERDFAVRIAHAPTDRKKKGTAEIIAAVEEVRNAGWPVELVLIEGEKRDRARELYRSCHFGIDQLTSGWYGNFSIEMMALGRPVIANIDPLLHRGRSDLPIVSATAANLSSTIKRVLESSSTWANLGIAGRDFVRSHHDVSQVVSRLLHIYRSDVALHDGDGYSYLRGAA